VPAAAVIPAPLAYTIIVAVKRLVVGLNLINNCILKKTTTIIKKTSLSIHKKILFSFFLKKKNK